MFIRCGNASFPMGTFDREQCQIANGLVEALCGYQRQSAFGQTTFFYIKIRRSGFQMSCGHKGHGT